MRIIQIVVSPAPSPGFVDALYALGDDGSLWGLIEPTPRAERSDWKPIPLPLGAVVTS